MRRSTRSQRGFTLVEVMVAAALVGVALVGLSQLLASSSATARTSQDMTAASYILNDRLEEISALGAARLAAGGTCVGAAPGCRGSPTTWGGAPGSGCAQYVLEPIRMGTPSPSTNPWAYRIDTGIMPHSETNHPDSMIATVSVCWQDRGVIREIQATRVVGDR